MRDKCSICNKFADIKPIRKVKCKAFGFGLEFEAMHQDGNKHRWKSYNAPKLWQEILNKAFERVEQ